MKWLSPEKGGGAGCGRCGEPRDAHEWRCVGCGTQAAEIGTCGCGSCAMPSRIACGCASSIGLFCRTAVRTIDDQEWKEIEELRRLEAELPGFPRFRNDWETEEAARLRAARGSPVLRQSS